VSREIIFHSRRGGDVFDLAANIIAQARYEWQEPMNTDYHAICWGDETMGWRTVSVPVGMLSGTKQPHGTQSTLPRMSYAGEAYSNRS